MAKVHEWKVTERGSTVVDVWLSRIQTTEDVFWSAGGDSYLLAAVSAGNDDGNNFHHQGVAVHLVSVNGAGEVRWYVEPRDIDWRMPYRHEVGESRDMVEAAHWFGLVCLAADGRDCRCDACVVERAEEQAG